MSEENADQNADHPIDRFFNDLKSLNVLIDNPGLDPDPERSDWQRQRERVDRADELALRVLAGFEALCAAEELPTELTELLPRLQASVAAAGSNTLALLRVAGRRDEARELLAKLRPVAAGTPEEPILAQAAALTPTDFLQLNRAYWLQRQQRRDEADALARELVKRGSPLKSQAQELLDVPRPMTRAPGLGTLNGVGTMLYGSRDRRDDGTYVATRYFTVLFLPVLPLGSYRVAPAGESSWYFLGKVPLGPIARLWRAAVPLTIAAIIAISLIGSYLSSPTRLYGNALAELTREESSAKTPATRRELARKYEALIDRFGGRLAGARLQPAAAAVLRLALADVPSPFTAAQLPLAKRLLERFRGLPSHARRGPAATLLADAFTRFSEQLGSRDERHVLARIELLDGVIAITEGATRRALQDKRREAQRALAAKLAASWPFEALALYVELGDQPAAKAAGVILDKLQVGPNVWLELAPTLTRWQRQAAGIAPQTLERVRDNLRTAGARVADPAYQKLLASKDAKALNAALGAPPLDQRIVVALASLERSSGQSANAVKTLRRLGSPGLMLRRAQLLLASVYSDLDRLPEADALLERLLQRQLPAFESARRAYLAADKRERDRLIAGARLGRFPGLSRKLRGYPKAEQGKRFAAWLRREMVNNKALQRLRQRYTSFADVVPLALTLGTVKLRRAQKKKGKLREQLLARAERVFLSIQAEAEGVPSYHLGLGQVYYRLGKQQAGEAQLRGVLARKDPLLTLAVARVYRLLGLVTRARQVAKDVYDHQPSPHKQQGAVILALLATDRDEAERWYKRADPKDPFVQNNLLQLAADRLLEQGKLAEADAKYAQVAKRFEKDAAVSGASANNAALAMGNRFACTGKTTHLDRALTVLEQARRLLPDSPLILTNLASSLSRRLDVAALAPLVELEILRPSNREASALVGRLLGTAQRPRLQAALRSAPYLERMVGLCQQEEVLAPNRMDAYLRQSGWYQRLDDLTALAKLADRVERLSGLESGDSDRNLADWIAGKTDATFRRAAQRRLASLDLRLKRAQRAKPATRAALLFLRADALRDLARTTNDPAPARQAVVALEQARKLWPAIGTGALLRALALQALLEAPKQSAVGKLWRAQGRRLGLELILLRAARKDAAARRELSASPSLRRAATIADTSRDERMHWMQLALAELSDNSALRAHVLKNLPRRSLRLESRIQRKLHPRYDAVRANAAALAALPN